ncbi:hypothetical protein [Arthrobacter sp. H14]|uniref:hypothetical protein n=1 Tax=Arthrobacter sp. H14 TaxID=1312959 RepID=UPI00047B8E30|nr:hypothetical protein [Arthrobacter sp. H14]
MHIPARYQDLLEDEPDTTERIRKGSGRIGAYRSSKPGVRRQVRLTGRAETQKTRRAAQAIKVTLSCPESLEELQSLAHDHYRDTAAADGRRVSSRTFMHPGNLDRITVNFIRHTRTVYDKSLLRSQFSSNDLRDHYNRELKIKCLAVIAEAFPDLNSECERQRLLVSKSFEEAAEEAAETLRAA